MIQNCKLDKRIGSKTWNERIFVTTMPRSRFDAFVLVLEIEGYNIEQLCENDITRELIVSILSEV
jgi:hypothetical protein